MAGRLGVKYQYCDSGGNDAMQTEFFTRVSTIRTIVSILWLAAAGFAFSQDESDPVVGRPDDTILFNRDCANEDAFQTRAYAIMASEDGAARALVRVSAGYLNPASSGVRLSLVPMELDLDLGAAWAEAGVSLRLLATATGAQAYSAAELTSFHSSRSMEHPVSQPFAADADGFLRWRDFAERDSAAADVDEVFSFTDGLALDASELGVADAGAPIRLNLLLRRVGGDEEILMTGPFIRIPARVWEMDAPQSRELGLLDTLNPSQSGGLFDALGRSFRFRNCIDERREARLEFDR